MIPAQRVNHSHHCRHCHHRHQLLLSTAAATLPLPPPPSIVVVDGSSNKIIVATAINCHCRQRRRNRRRWLHPTAASVDDNRCRQRWRRHPCLRRHYCCSLCRSHCASDAPVDGWLLCRLSPLACCVVRRPNLSAPAVMRSSTLLPPGRRPLSLTIASCCPVALLPTINCFCGSR